MKSITKITAIFMIVVVALIAGKNYFLEYSIANELSKYKVKHKDIVCNGFYSIDCKLHSLGFAHSENTTEYNFTVESIVIENIIGAYQTYTTHSNNNFAIDIQKLLIIEDKNAFEQLSQPINIEVQSKDELLTAELRSNQMEIAITTVDKSKFHISTMIQDDSMKSILYELYKLKYLETKAMDGDAIAKGINISFGIPLDTFIPKGDFLAHAMPRLIDLTVSEIESHEFFGQYNHDEKLSNLMRDILSLSGKNSYEIVLKTQTK